MIGEQVRHRREQLGITGAQLAARAGLAPSAVSQIETGKRTPSSASVVKLAEGLGIGVGELYPKAQAPLPLEASAAGSVLLDRVMNAARQDEEKTRKATNRLFSSEGRPQGIVDFAEDRIRAELRAAGFPDEYFENFLWPLAVGAARAARLEEELARLRAEVAVFDERPASVE